MREDGLGGQKPYVGQAKDLGRFEERQREHARANPDAIYEYRVIDRGTPGQHLDKLEEYHIRRLGGPTNKGNPDGLLENKRHQMREARYQAAGGDPY